MAKTKKTEPAFEEILAEAEENIGALENGGLGLEEALKLYENGVKKLSAAGAIIAKAEKRIQELTENADGEPELRDFARAPETVDAEEDE